MYSLYFDTIIKKYNYECVSNIRNVNIDEICEIIIHFYINSKIKVSPFINRHEKNKLYNSNINYEIYENNKKLILNTIYNLFE
jgi:hypothetical protein